MPKQQTDRGPWLPPARRECHGQHVTLVAILPGEVSQCRYCGCITLPSGRTSKRDRTWPPVAEQRARNLT